MAEKENRRPRRAPREAKEFEERVVRINRISKTVKGGRRMRFSALVVVGDKKGRVGFGLGKANEVPDAIKKAIEAAKKNVRRVPLIKGHRTLSPGHPSSLRFRRIFRGIYSDRRSFLLNTPAAWPSRSSPRRIYPFCASLLMPQAPALCLCFEASPQSKGWPALVSAR